MITSTFIKQVPNAYFICVNNSPQTWINLANVVAIKTHSDTIAIEFIGDKQLILDRESSGELLEAIKGLSPHKSQRNIFFRFCDRLFNS